MATSDDNNNFDDELRKLLSTEMDRFIRDADADAKATEGRTPLDERIERYAATLPPDERDDLLTGWPYFKTVASEAELENISRSIEGETTRRVLRRIARLRSVAKLEPEKAEELIRSWRYLQTQHSEDKLDQMFSSYRAEQRERMLKELEHLYKLGDGESGEQRGDSV